MSFLPGGLRALKEYLARMEASGGDAKKETIRKAVQLTEVQHIGLQTILQLMWKNPDYICPTVLDVRPKHGWDSRVMKDGFTPEQYGKWLELGCTDLALVGTDSNGRPRLFFGPNTDFPSYKYTLIVPVTSDALGTVYIGDVYPSGLPAGATKTMTMTSKIVIK